MTKNLLFAVALMSLALAGGCAKGGNGGTTPPITLDVTITSPQDVAPTAVYATQSVTLTATPSSGSAQPVSWTLTGGGTLTPVSPATTPPTAIYVAPAAATTGVSIMATETSDASITGSVDIDVVDVSVIVTPVFNVNVGENLTQYFTATAVPDYAPQTFTWSCTPTGSCGSLTLENQTATYSGLVSYTAPAASGSVVVSATSTVPETTAAVGQSDVKVAASRLAQGNYAYRFSGYNSAGNAVAVAGSVTADGSGNITNGVEDVVINGGYTQYTTVTGTYTPSSNNNQGTLKLSAGGGPTYSYIAVLTASGTIRMIESDSSGITGSGVMEKSAANTVFNSGAQTFAFGFEGLDVNGNRVGYVGLLPMTPNGNGSGGTITGGLIDSNDNGTATTYSSVTGTYGTNLTSTTCGTGTLNMKLSAGGTAFNFDFFVAGGQTKTSSGPLTLYAVACDATYQALSGNMVYQFPMSSGYNNAAFAGASVSSLRGVHTASSAEVPNTSNVALVNGATDGTSSGSGGTGGFAGTSDQNDNGTLTSIPVATPFSYTYCSTSTTSSTCTPSTGTGRYIFNMLGNPNASPAVSSVPFVLYASGANRGFLLAQSSATVMTGSMDPQPTLKNFDYSPDELPGTYAVATIGNSDPELAPEVQNLLLTSTGGATYVVAGTEYTKGGSNTMTGAYTINFSSPGAGTGTIVLTTPAAPLVTNYVIYAIDASAISGTGNDVITDFMMMGLTSGTPSTIMFAQQ